MDLLFEHSGYAAEVTDGLLLAAFADPAMAVAWSLALVQAMPKQVGDRRGQAYKGIQGHTRAYKGIQGHTKAYKGIQGHTRAYKGIHCQPTLVH